jgi:uncharacterized membrane protein YfcA
VPDLLPALAIGGLAGLVRGLSGFGAGLVMVPLLLLLAPPAVAVPAASLAAFLGALPQLPGAWRAADRGLLLRLTLAATLALPLGIALLLAVPGPVLARSVGAFVMLSSLALAAARGWGARPTAGRTLLTGAACGLAGGVSGLPGPPVVLYLLACRLPAATARGTLIAFLTAAGAIQLAGFGAAGLVGAPAATLAAALVPGMVLFGWAGERLFRLTGDRHYRAVAVALLLATGAAALLDGGR